MTCASCVSAIENYLQGTEGVHSVTVALLTEKAEVVYDRHVLDEVSHPSLSLYVTSRLLSPFHFVVTRLVSQDKVKAAIEDLGYEAQVLEQNTQGIAHLVVEGMSCASCVGRIEEALRAKKGVREAVVNLVTGKAKVTTLFLRRHCVQVFLPLGGGACVIFDAASSDVILCVSLSLPPPLMHRYFSQQVEFDPTLIGIRDVISAVEAAGPYSAKLATAEASADALKRKKEIRKWQVHTALPLPLVNSFLLLFVFQPCTARCCVRV